MSDSYPEYLNPFAEDLKPKSKLTIRNSFKEFKRSLRQSFRIKKKENEVIVRPKQENFQRPPVTSYNPPIEALPRSRFHERVSRDSKSLVLNPFEQDEKSEMKPAIRRRKSKKQAPLPPKSISSQNLNNSILANSEGSNWSLTSVETDYSGTDIRDDQDQSVNRNSLVETFADFNKSMATLKDDTNNNVITKDEEEEEEEEKKTSYNIPDLVVSCPSESDSDKFAQNEDDEKSNEKLQTEEEKLNGEIESKNEEKKVTDSEESLHVTDITGNMIEDNCNRETQQKDYNDANHNQIQQENYNDESQQNNCNEKETENFFYVEKQLLYIDDSKDEVNDAEPYTERVSVDINRSCDNFDSSNNNEILNKNIPNENSNDDAVPKPKQRKNKLTKNILLGM